MILVTGGAGYIGSHYAQYEQRRNNEIVVLDNMVYGHPEAVENALLIEGDVRNRPLLDSIFQQHQIDTVVHFAAFAAVGESVIRPEMYYNNNVVATLTLLDAMREHNVKNIVFSSTCATYGSPVTIPMSEDHPQKPINPYGESKLFCEQMMAAYHKAYGLNYCALRYFNAAGADPEGRIGESHNPESHLIPIALQTALGKRDGLTVYGEDYDTPDGTCIRDYIHIVDLAQAHSLAREKLIAGGPSGAYNLGTEHGNSVRDVIAVCERVCGLKIPVSMGARRPGDPARLIASAVRAREELGWNPEFPGLEEIVRTAWAWESNRRY